MLRSALDEVKQLAALKQSMSRTVAALQQDAVEKDAEIQRLLAQREVDFAEKTELGRQLNDALDALTAIKRERNVTLDGLVTIQAQEEIDRAGEREERARLAQELHQVSADFRKVTSERDHLQWCLEKEREQREVSETALRQTRLQQQQAGEMQELQRQSEHNKERSKTMARSLAAVIQEKDSLLRRNRELERAITPVSGHSSPYIVSARDSPSMAVTSSLGQQHPGMSPPRVPYAASHDRLPPRSPSTTRSPHQTSEAVIYHNPRTVSNVCFGTERHCSIVLVNLMISPDFLFRSVAFAKLCDASSSTPSPGSTWLVVTISAFLLFGATGKSPAVPDHKQN